MVNMVTEDISNRTILILVILTVLVSTLGTLTVLESASKVDATRVSVGQTQVDSGKIMLEIAQPPPMPTGQIILNIGDSSGSN